MSYVRLLCFSESIHEVAGPSPNLFPFGEHAAALLGDSVVATRWTGVGGHDATGQQIPGGKRTKDGVNGAFLKDGRALIGTGQTLGDFIPVKVLGRFGEHREQNQANQASV